MEILSIREKKIKESLDIFFKGVDDDVLKTVMLYTALGKSEEEKDAICEVLRKKREDDMKYIEQFEIVVDKDHPEGILNVVNPKDVTEINIIDSEKLNLAYPEDIKKIQMEPEYELTETKKYKDNIEEDGDN